MNNFYENLKNLSQEQLNSELIDACEKGELNKVKYLLSSHELSIHADIHFNKDQALINACERKRTDIVKYLLSSNEIKEHAHIHAQGDTPFYKTMNNKNWELIEYYIFEIDIEHDASIKSYLNIFSKQEEDRVINMFKVRDLNKELNDNSKNNISKTNKVKI